MNVEITTIAGHTCQVFYFYHGLTSIDGTQYSRVAVYVYDRTMEYSVVVHGERKNLDRVKAAKYEHSSYTMQNFPSDERKTLAIAMLAVVLFLGKVIVRRSNEDFGFIDAVFKAVPELLNCDSAKDINDDIVRKIAALAKLFVG